MAKPGRPRLDWGALIPVFGNRGKGFRQRFWDYRALASNASAAPAASVDRPDFAGALSGLQDRYQKREKSMERLKGKTAMVVGAGSIGPGWGNGKATAVTFAREGAQVFCVDRNGKAAQETVDIITSEGGKAAAFTADVSRAADVEAMVTACLKAYGRIDVLDNNVGIAEMGSVVDITEAEWDRVFAVNLKSAFLAMKHVIPVMAKQGGGSIINISSIASIRHLGISYVSYGTSKAAMNMLTKTTAVEFAAKHIRVNAILPGLMKTPMVEHSAGLASSYAAGDVEAMWRARDAQVPMGHMGDAWDVANAALFLASDESKYVTGIELVVDGGITLKVS
jgi:NAD(P)-dependent dehydrogenase (short-subunit alcohol dehydrogenase family)